MYTPSITSQSLEDFYKQSNVRGLTLDIDLWQEKQDELINHKGDRGIPIRRSHRFGQRKKICLEHLEKASLDFIQGCENKNLVLIGFELAAEWTFLSRYIPQAIPLFSAWIDLRDIAKDITSVGVIPGLVSLLKIFGYHWKDIQPRRVNSGSGVADNAGNDAVATCALAHALRLPGNQEKLKLRQKYGQIALIYTKKKGYRNPDERDHFTTTLHTHGPLPTSLNTGMKLAQHFFGYSPKSVGIISGEKAYVTFRSQEQVDQFITAVQGLMLPSGEVLQVQQEKMGTEGGDQERNKIRAQREAKRLELTRGDVEDLGSIFD